MYGEDRRSVIGPRSRNSLALSMVVTMRPMHMLVGNLFR
jgi:hypothetical protein